MRDNPIRPSERHAVAPGARRWGNTWLWALALVAGILVLFPFDWLANVWPAYAAIFDRVFVSAGSHMIGHALLFCIAGLLVLIAIPALRPRPVLYLGVMVLASLAEESIQSLFKLHVPTPGDGRDLMMDLIGYVSAYAVTTMWRWRWRRAAQP